MVNSLEVKTHDDGTSHVKYTVTFTGTNHVLYGDFDTTIEETNKAFSNIDTKDVWKGFKILTLKRLISESENALNGGNENE